MTKTSATQERKDAHIKICEEENVQYCQGAGFEDVLLVHNALPEADLAKINTCTNFLKKRLDAPILISAMTGGTQKGLEINKKLAIVAEKEKIALALGSCRPMLEDESKANTYMVRKEAPSIPIIANIGAVQIKEYDVKKIEWMINKIDADALNVHLNSLQEAIQPEGQTNFGQVIVSIEKLCSNINVPVIAKETGAGINGDCAKKLFDAGVKIVDVAGRGGTSWSKVEYARGGRLAGFEEWGYPSIPALVESAQYGDTICSGGVRDGIDVANSIALGAKLAGAAIPFLKAKKCEDEIKIWKEQFKAAMFLCGAKSVQELACAPVLITGRSAEILRLRGIEPADFARRDITGTKKKRFAETNYI
ncbi:MAG: type 2 isopentenyl-diphosphate Delta-isomerase [Candidatus Micrarchaeia archaeon]